MPADQAYLQKEAERALAQGDGLRAKEVYRGLLTRANVIEFEYNSWLLGAARAYRGLGKDREAGYLYLCLGEPDKARECFHKAREAMPLHMARAVEMEAHNLRLRTGERAAPLFREAAQLYDKAAYPVLSALSYAEADDTEAARACWRKVLSHPRLHKNSYEHALCHFNLGLLGRRLGERKETTRHTIEAQQILEALADDFETRGERERAFDCYAVLLKLGQTLGSYENLAEGYINCIRVLKEDNLTYYVLQYYEDFLHESLHRKEYHAAATVFREAAAFGRKQGLLFHGDYLRRAAEAFCLSAQKNDGQEGTAQLSENAYLQAVDCYLTLGDLPKVKQIYKKLVALPLSDKERQRHERILTLLSKQSLPTVSDPPPFPAYLKQEHAYPDIWHIDMVEWQHDGDPEPVAASILIDTKYSVVVRRRALALLLTLSEDRPSFVDVAKGLGQMQTYASLRPLERLYEQASGRGEDPKVKRAVMAALPNLCYKRSFHLINKGLVDPDAGVREHALDALRALHFPHAVDPLIRIFREHTAEAVKRVALESLGRVSDLSAGQFLLDVLRYEPSPYAEIAKGQLMKFGNPDLRPLLAHHAELAEGELKHALDSILRSL